MDRKTRKLRKIVFESLDAIYKASIKTAKAWDKKAASIPIDLLSVIIDKAKWKVGKGNKVSIDYAKQYNKMLDLINSSLISNAKAYGSEAVNLEQLANVMNKIKESFDIGVNKNH